MVGNVSNAEPICPDGTEAVPWSNQTDQFLSINFNSRLSTNFSLPQIGLCQVRYQFPGQPITFSNISEIANSTSLFTNVIVTAYDEGNIAELGNEYLPVLTPNGTQESTVGFSTDSFLYFTSQSVTNSSDNIFIRDLFLYWSVNNGATFIFNVGESACPVNYIDINFLIGVGANYFPFNLGLNDVKYRGNPTFLCMSFDCLFPCENNGTRDQFSIFKNNCTCTCPFPYYGKYCSLHLQGLFHVEIERERK